MNTVKLLTAALITTSTLLGSPISHAGSNAGYSHDSSVGAYNPGWMSMLPDSRRFSELTIPATHDSMSFHGGDIGQTQSMSLTQQLQSGIRYLDIRCRHMNNTFKIYHGIQYQYADFRDVLSAAKAFLQVNTRETIYIMVASETTDVTPEVGNTRTFTETFAAYQSEFPGLFWGYSNGNPTLGETRGKVVLIQGWSGAQYGIYRSTFDINKDDWSQQIWQAT